MIFQYFVYFKCHHDLQGRGAGITHQGGTGAGGSHDGVISSLRGGERRGELVICICVEIQLYARQGLHGLVRLGMSFSAVSRRL